MIEQLAKEVIETVKSYTKNTVEKVKDSISILTNKVSELENTVNSLPTLEKGDKGEDGKNFTIEDAQPLLTGIKADLTATLEAAIKTIPTPKDGEDGKDGIDGEDGKSVTIEDLQPTITTIKTELTETLNNAIKSIPTPRDGDNGKDGKSFTIEDAKDLIENHLAKWELNFERRATAVLEKAIDKLHQPKDGENGKDGEDGADGKDGIDGVGFEDVNLDFDGIKTVIMQFKKGDISKELTIKLPVIVDCGVFKEANQYTKGDAVTWGGSLWIAQKDNTTEKPDGNNADWRLAVKRGRDGKDGRNGIDFTKQVTIKGN